MLARDCAVLLDRELGLLLAAVLEEKYHRAPRRRRIVRTMIWGKLIVASVEGEDIVWGYLASVAELEWDVWIISVGPLDQVLSLVGSSTVTMFTESENDH